MPTKEAVTQQGETNGEHAITLPVLHTRIPAPGRDLLYYAGVGGLAVFGAIEWPVAALIGVGYAVLSDRKRPNASDDK